MNDWGTWFQGVTGNLLNTYANYKYNADPNVIMAKEYAEAGYYQPGQRAGAVPQGSLTVTSDILVLGGLALLFVFAMRGD